MHQTLLAVMLALSGSAPLQADADPIQLYALAVEHLLRAPGEHDFVVLAAPPTAPAQLRARRASGPARAPTAEDARRVAERLARQGYRSRRGTGAQLRLALGELRLEPPESATFARLLVEVSSTAGGAEVLEFLLKRDRDGWRVLKSEVSGSLGAAGPRRGDPSGPVPTPSPSAPPRS